jgi:hypothetical protein
LIRRKKGRSESGLFSRVLLRISGYLVVTW